MRGMTIAFDLDGTLVDTAPDLIRANTHVLALQGLGAAPESIVRPKISFGSRQMILASLAHHGVTLPDAEVDQLWRTFLAHYEANVAVESRPFPGLVAALERIRDAGGQCVVCTNKLEGMSRKLLDELDLTQYFAGIAGRDTFPVYKPDPRHLTGAVSLAGGAPHRAVMVGDSDVDIATAKAAGIPVVAVTFGYVHAPVATFSPDAIIDHFDDLDESNGLPFAPEPLERTPRIVPARLRDSLRRLWHGTGSVRRGQRLGGGRCTTHGELGAG
jgi:phosphoglycolate phosphatase